MKNENLLNDSAQPEQLQESTPRRKKFHGFSMGFLLILLAVMVGVYIICTVMAGS